MNTIKYLIVGGANDNGIKICKSLLLAGDKLVLVDSFYTKSNLNSKEIYFEYLKKFCIEHNIPVDNYEIIKGDISSISFLKSIISIDINRVIHVDHKKSYRIYEDNREYYNENALETAMLLEVCKQKDIKEFIALCNSSITKYNKSILCNAYEKIFGFNITYIDDFIENSDMPIDYIIEECVDEKDIIIKYNYTKMSV